MDSKDKNMYGQQFTESYNKNFQEFEDRMLRVYNHLLAASVSLQALLLPLVIYLKTSGYATRLLIWAGASLLLCSLVTVGGLVLGGVGSLMREKLSKTYLEYLKGDEQLPEKDYTPPHLSLLVVAIVSAICFLSAAVLLFWSLTQIFFS